MIDTREKTVSKQNFRDTLVKNSTKAEIELRVNLASNSLTRSKFTCQHIIGPYIVDFYFQNCGLAVEVDGSYHDYTKEYDLKRTEILKTKYGVKHLIRFTNKEVFTEIKMVMNTIKKHVCPESVKKFKVNKYYRKKRKINYKRMRTY